MRRAPMPPLLARPDGARTAAEARRALAAKFRAAGLDSPDLDARILVGHALGLDHAALAAAAHAQAWRRRGKRHRRFGEPPPRRRAGRAHSRLQGILELAAARRCRDAGAETGNRNGRRGGARGDRCGRPALAKAAHRRPRHRQRRAPSGIAVRTAERLRRRHRYEYEGACGGARQCPPSRPDRASSSPATWRRRCVDRSM